ncbi:hypothetical protein [Nonomuraea maritima]|uniref:hypothetical protein n=1 Tax=Nonomuraea maritima TaxID=683260 RepID=UPI003723D6A5
MSHGDDLDERFNELISQIDKEEQRTMRAAAKRAAGTARPERLPAYVPERRPARRNTRGRLVLGAVAALIVAGGVIVTYRPEVLAPGVAALSGAVPEETTPVVVEPPEELVTGDLRTNQGDPFAGSQAEKWAAGIDGFVMPKAKAMGGLSKKDVAKGLERTRDLLAAAHLDRKTLLGGTPDAFARLLDRAQRGWFRDGLDDKERSTRTTVTSFAPKTAELATDVIKVRGRTTLGTFEEDGLRGVQAKLNYLVVYAVQRPGQPATVERIVIHFTGATRLQRLDGRLAVWVTDWGASATPARCDVVDGFVHPFYDDSPPDKVDTSGPPTDPYDLDDEPAHDGSCEASQGT